MDELGKPDATAHCKSKINSYLPRMNYKKLIPQYILALMMLVFGLNKFFGFMAMPKPDGDALTYMPLLGYFTSRALYYSF